MEKKNSIIILVLTTLLVASLIVIFYNRYFFHNLFSVEKRSLAPGQSNVTFGTDLAGGVQAILSPKLHKQFRQKELEDRLGESAEIIRNRLSRYGDLQPDVRVSGDNKIHILIPGLQDPERIVDVIGETGTLQIYLLKNSDDQGIVQRRQNYQTGDPSTIDLNALFSPNDFEYLIADTKDIGNVKTEYDKSTRDRYIGFDIVNDEALLRMQNAMYKRGGSCVAVVFSGDIQRILMLQKSETRNIIPTIGEKRFAITSSKGFTKTELEDYLILLESRPLPIELNLERRNFVFPSIGTDTQRTLLYLVMASLLVVTIFFYAAFGELLGTVGFILISITVLLQVGVYAAFGLVITLPAIAGLLLCIGITIDAAVLVFEKIKTKALSLMQTAAKEETFLSGFIKETVGESSKVVWILRITDVIGALVLVFYTSNKGPVAGFGMALLVGSVLSLFLYSRFVFVALIDFCRAIIFRTKSFRAISYGIRFDNSFLMRAFYSLIGLKKTVYYALLICMLVSFVLVFIIGFNFGIDFTGGNNFVLSFPERMDFNMFDSLLRTGLNTNNFELRELASSEGSTYNLRTSMEVSDAELAGLFANLKNVSGHKDVKILSSSSIGPELQKDEIWKAAKSLLIILGVVWIVTAFLFLRNDLGLYNPNEDNYYVGKPILFCILALFHDVLILSGFLVLFRIEISAGIMSVIFLLAGYSINDSLVFLSVLKEKQKLFFTGTVFNTAREYVDDALRRVTVKIFLTSSSAIIVLIPLVLIGNNELRDYGISIIVGMIVGTLSTVFLVSVLMESFLTKRRLAPAQ